VRSTAARPKGVPRAAAGVPIREEVDSGVSGVVDRRLPPGFDREPDPGVVVTLSDWRRGVLAPVERERESADVVRVRVGAGLRPSGVAGASELGEVTIV
jgi:hypothetical protein